MMDTENIEKIIEKSYLKNLHVPTGTEMDERILDNALTIMEESKKSRPVLAGTNIGRVIMKSRITKLAAAAVIAVTLLVPLGYGTANIIKRLVIGSVEIDNFKGQFKLSKNIHVELEVGTTDVPNIVSAENIRFFVENEQISGTLRCNVRSWPKFKWRTKVELMSAKGKRLGYTEHVSENGGVKVHEYAPWFDRDIHFSLGRWSDILQPQRFRVRLERVPEETEITPDAWVESSELDIVHGRVVGPGGKAIPNAEIQIREKRKPGQRGIAAPDVSTDKQGYYSFDGIKWPYRVSVLVYETLPSGQGYRHQFKRLNEVLEGSQTVDFRLAKFPAGSAILSGKTPESQGQSVGGFTVDVRSAVNWNDYSAEYLYQFGCRQRFATLDGTFEIGGLPVGTYDISITPTTNEVLEESEFVRIRNYVCELREGRRTEISAQNTEEKAWYGRVLFEDGIPAVPDLPGLKTQIIVWGQDYTMGSTVAIVDENGYFTALMPDKGMEQLKSGKAWLTASIAKANIHHKVQKGKRIPVELLSPQRDKAGVLRIIRPKVYYGRILYENDKPGVPERAPWPGARVYVVLRYSPATSRSGGITEDLGDVDEQGYFMAFLTDKQLKQIKDGELKIQIYHPSYEQKRHSYPIGIFPGKMLTTEQNKAIGYKFPYDEMSSKFKNLKQQLESVEKLKELGSALSTYCKGNTGKSPPSLGDLKSYDVEEELLAWAAEHVEYLGSGEISPVYEPAGVAIAYDKALLEKASGTNVLFYDGHVEFCLLKKLEALGISR